MSITDKLAAIAENQPKVYDAGKRAVLKASRYMNGSASGEAITLDDVSSVMHELGVKVKSNANWYNAQITEVAEWDGALSAHKRELKEGVWYVGLTANNYWNPKNITNYSTSEGSITFTTALALYGVGQAFKCQPQQTYYFRCQTSQPSTETRVCWFGCYDADGNFIYYRSASGSVATITTPANCYWLTVCPCGSAGTQVTYSQIQLSTEPIDSYTPYPDLTTVTVMVNGTEPYPVNADGTVDGVTRRSPGMTLTTDTDGVTMDCSYLRDIDTYIDNLTENIALTGGI